MDVGLRPDLLLPETVAHLPPDVVFQAQSEIIDDLIRQRDASDALSARLLVVSLVLSVLSAALFALWWLN